MSLQVYSTLTRKKEPFPKKPGEPVSMYVCGPTVYKPSHIGHMVGPVIFDTVKRYLTYLGYKVTFVVNITDVDDKLIKRAAELKTTVPALAEKNTADYFACLKALNVTGIDHFPRATQYIGGMIDVIQTLKAKDIAYELEDGVYFDVSKDPDYGKLSNRDPEQMEAGARLEPNARKRNPGDFALWKGAKPDEPKEVQFESPFKCGRGRPGWHIECTCMALSILREKGLGETLDIHGGGLDLQFPHHENELAQSESLTGKKFAHVWMHNGLLKMGTAKMAGSVGNVVNIADLLKPKGKYDAETVRLLLLSTHYRSPIEYSEERLDEVAKSLESFYRLFERYTQITEGESFYQLPADPMSDHLVNEAHENIVRLRKAFLEAMEDDFNTGRAVGVLFLVMQSLNSFVHRMRLDEAEAPRKDKLTFRRGVEVLRELSSILGLFWERRPTQSSVGASLTLKWNVQADASGQSNKLIDGLMQLLLDLRNNLRATAKEAAKDNPLKKSLFDQTDLIRKRLAELGVTLEDRPGGTTWRVG